MLNLFLFFLLFARVYADGFTEWDSFSSFYLLLC